MPLVMAPREALPFSHVRFLQVVVVPPALGVAYPTMIATGLAVSPSNLCKAHSVAVNRQAVVLEGLPIRLCVLHTLVLRCGGVYRVFALPLS